MQVVKQGAINNVGDSLYSAVTAPINMLPAGSGGGSLQSDWENADELLPLEPTPVQLCLRRRRRRCCNEHPVECDVTTRLDTGPRDNYNTSLHNYTTTALFLSA